MMRNVLLSFLMLLPVVLLAQNNFTYNLGLGIDGGRYKLKYVPSNQSWNDINVIYAVGYARYVVDFDVEYKNRLTLSLGTGIFVYPQQITDFFPSSSLTLKSRIWGENYVTYGISSEHNFRRYSEGESDEIVAQTGFGFTLGFQRKRFKTQWKYLWFRHNHLDFTEGFYYAHSMFALKFSYAIINGDKRKKKKNKLLKNGF